MSAKYQTYPEYKDSGVKWLGMVPTYWEIKKLGHFFEERKEKVSDKNFPPLSVTMQGIVPQLATAAKTDAGDNRKLVLKNDFVINSRSDRKGSSGVSPYDGSVSLISIVFSPRRIQPAFVHHLLRSYPFQEEFYRHGKGIVADLWSTNSSEMKNILIPDISEDEQTQIANFLDYETVKIDTLIEKQQLLIKLLKEKRQAVISHAVTKGLNPDAPMRDSGVEWLGEVPEHWIAKNSSYLFSTSPRNGISPAVSTSTNAIPTFSISAVRNGKVDIKNNVKWTSLSDEEAKRFRIKSNTILLVRGNGNLSMVGQAGLTDKVIPNKCIYPDILIKIELSNSKMTNEFFVYAWNSFYVREQLERKAKTTNGTYKVSGADIKNITLAEPPIEEQKLIAKWIAEAISKLEKLMDSAEIMLRHLKERRTALISAAVTGKIDVRNWRSPEQIQLNGEETP